jgi:hypothetical protein
MTDCENPTTNNEGAILRDVPVDWEALEDAFENNAPEVHSYLQLRTGEVLRVVDGIADPEMHSRIASDSDYLRVEPVSSREQYRWMERFIPLVEDTDLRQKLVSAIDGKGAFRRFKDVLMGHVQERERWFAFRSERLRVFMEAWLSAHSLQPVARPVTVAEEPEPQESQPVAAEAPQANRRSRGSDQLRRQIKDVCDGLGGRDLEKVLAFAEFVRARRVARGHHGRDDLANPDSAPEHSLDADSEPLADAIIS